MCSTRTGFPCRPSQWKVSNVANTGAVNMLGKVGGLFSSSVLWFRYWWSSFVPISSHLGVLAWLPRLQQADIGP